MTKVFIVNGNREYHDLFKSFGMNIVPNETEVDLLVFTGGADVSPQMYGDKPHKSTFNDYYRDKVEQEFFSWATKNNKKMVGICRGGQFLNVMSGGRMYQDVTGHTRSHYIVDEVTGETVYVSSTHHQMMMPGKAGVLVAHSININSNREWVTDGIVMADDSKFGNEVVYYPHTQSLCFQPHPEFNNAEYEGMKAYFRSLLKRYLNV